MSKKKEFTISAEKRESLGKGSCRALRREKRMPAVLYGFGGPATSLTLSDETCTRVLSHSGMITVDIAGERKASAIFKDIQRHPVSGRTLHLDLQEVRADQVITSMVVLEPHGEPAGVHLGGQLEQMVHEIEVRCLPADMVDSIVVDISGLELDMTMHLKDVPLPEGIEATADADLSVFQVRLASIDADDEEEGVDEEGLEEGEEAAEADGEAGATE